MKGSNSISKRIALVLAVAAVAAPAAQAADRPDNRPGPLGAAPAVAEPASALRPDNRPGPLGIGEVVPADETASAPRPDNRPGPLGVGEVDFIPVSNGDGFDWGDAGIGVVSGFGFALALTGGLLLVLRRLPIPRKTGSAATG
jgi:hypothetical protein